MAKVNLNSWLTKRESALEAYGKLMVFDDFKSPAWQELMEIVLEELGGIEGSDNPHALAENHPKRPSVITSSVTMRWTVEGTYVPVTRRIWRL